MTAWPSTSTRASGSTWVSATASETGSSCAAATSSTAASPSLSTVSSFAAWTVWSWTTSAWRTSPPATGSSTVDICSPSAPASSNLLMTPSPTRASPSRSPVWRWRVSARSSSSSVTNPRVTKISPIRRQFSLSDASSPGPASRPLSCHCSATTCASSAREMPKRSTRISPSCWSVSCWISSASADLALGDETALDEERADEA